MDILPEKKDLSEGGKPHTWKEFRQHYRPGCGGCLLLLDSLRGFVNGLFGVVSGTDNCFCMRKLAVVFFATLATACALVGILILTLLVAQISPPLEELPEWLFSSANDFLLSQERTEELNLANVNAACIYGREGSCIGISINNEQLDNALRLLGNI